MLAVLGEAGWKISENSQVHKHLRFGNNFKKFMISELDSYSMVCLSNLIPSIFPSSHFM